MEKLFYKAMPIWIKDKEVEMNLRVQFKTIIDCYDQAKVSIATSGIYQMLINGEFVAYGPARAGKGTFRVDEIDISKCLKNGKNSIVIEVDGYNTDSFYIQNQPSFLQTEIINNDVVIAYTGRDFSARINPYYYRKMQRYGWQRPMIESYGYYNPQDDYLVSFTDSPSEEIIITQEKKVIKRLAPYPIYERIFPKEIFNGTFDIQKPEKYIMPRVYDEFGNIAQMGFAIKELKYFLSNDYQEMIFNKKNRKFTNIISEKEFRTYELSHNSTGMFSAEFVCDCDTSLYFAFDEVLVNGDINPLRSRCCNIIRYDLSKGRHTIRFFEVYTMKYFKIICVSGKTLVNNMQFIEYKHPPIMFKPFGDSDTKKIIEAGIETFRQCSVDILMDCPSRERAGWLCDSYFSGRAEYTLTGRNIIEKSFLENFLHTDDYETLPKGMVPMCYPADHPDGVFIPNWSLWLIVELADYHKRNNDIDFINEYKNKITGILDYFIKFENEFGLLENLENWVFLEWSHANDEELIREINFPTNMLYYKALLSVYELYNDEHYLDKANKLKGVINNYSFNGKFYNDHAKRNGKQIITTQDSTEVCQYYAFFCGIADKESKQSLFNILINEFVPNRDTQQIYPKICSAQPFIGNYLRLDIMLSNGLFDDVVKNIKDYFLYMAEENGTLWERAEKTNSCNHGFASYVIYLLDECRKGNKL